MNGIYVNYDPFSMESQVLIVEKGKTIGQTYYKSELNQLAEQIATYAKDNSLEDLHVFVRAPGVFYTSLENRIKDKIKKYSLTKITLEKV